MPASDFWENFLPLIPSDVISPDTIWFFKTWNKVRAMLRFEQMF